MQLTAFFLVLVGSLTSSAQDLGPEELIRQRTTDLLETIHSSSRLQAYDRVVATEIFLQKIEPLLDYREGARRALGATWKEATPDQQERIVKEFRGMIVRIYPNLISFHPKQTIRIEPLRLPPEATVATVRNQFLKPGMPPLLVEYRMHKTAAGWRIYDCAVEGVSFVQIYRTEFDVVIRDSGIEGLIKRMTEKNTPPVFK